MSLYAELVAAGVPTANHYSDLYAKVTPESHALVRAAMKRREVSDVKTFQNQVEGGTWFDIPFAYVPYWETIQAEEARRVALRSTT